MEPGEAARGPRRRRRRCRLRAPLRGRAIVRRATLDSIERHVSRRVRG